MATRLLAAADGLEPSEPSHLVMNEFDLRAVTAAGLGSDAIDEAVHHAFHEHGVAKVVALDDTWAAAAPMPCGGRTIPIIYGMPVPALGERDLGVVELAGCIIDVDDPARRSCPVAPRSLDPKQPASRSLVARWRPARPGSRSM